MNNERQYLKEKYHLQLQEIDRFPVWTLEQIKDYVRISWETVQNLVSHDLLYEFKISYCKFYSTKNKKYSNKVIRKSILNIDVDYTLNSGSCVLDSYIDDKSLISRNVRRVGVMNYEGRNTDFYVCALTYPLDCISSYKRFEKLMIDIQTYSQYDYVYILCMSPYVKDINNSEGDFWDYMLNKSQLNDKGYYTSNFIHFNVREDKRPCFKYVSEE